MLTLYGISNCDTVKKARRWLDDHNVPYSFHDYKKSGIDEKTLKVWCRELGYERLVNTRGTTWRNLDDVMKKDLNKARAIRLMLDNTSVIKRPMLVDGERLLIGFDESEYETLL